MESTNIFVSLKELVYVMDGRSRSRNSCQERAGSCSNPNQVKLILSENYLWKYKLQRTQCLLDANLRHLVPSA
jgi:hypothetical protein